MMMMVMNKYPGQKRDADSSGVSEGRVETTASNFLKQPKNLFFSLHKPKWDETSASEEICCLGIWPSSHPRVAHSRFFTVSFESRAFVGFAFKRLRCLCIFPSWTRSLTLGVTSWFDQDNVHQRLFNLLHCYSQFKTSNCFLGFFLRQTDAGSSRMEFLI